MLAFFMVTTLFDGVTECCLKPCQGTYEYAGHYGPFRRHHLHITDWLVDILILRHRTEVTANCPTYTSGFIASTLLSTLSGNGRNVDNNISRNNQLNLKYIFHAIFTNSCNINYKTLNKTNEFFC